MDNILTCLTRELMKLHANCFFEIVLQPCSWNNHSVLVFRNIEELTRFPGLPQKKQLTYSAKQLIAREVC